MPFGFKLSHRLSLTKAAVGTIAVRVRRTADCPPRRVVHTPHSSVAAPAASGQRASAMEQTP